MKKIFLSVSFLVATIGIKAQLPPKTVTTKPAAVKPVFKNLMDSVSYVIGVSFTNFYKDQGITITNLNSAMVSKAIVDALAGKPSLIDNNTANAVMNKCLNQLQEEKIKRRRFP